MSKLRLHYKLRRGSNDSGKVKRASYTLKNKLEAVRLFQNGQSCAATAKVLRISSQTLENWVRQAVKRQLTGAAAKPVNAEQM
ncbi:MAG: helix-turn-helix domain-containing protein [Nitrosomonas sp.]|nr:MAG: helix-turn-helix domain-containing protein [Nitrosomonas sp.]